MALWIRLLNGGDSCCDGEHILLVVVTKVFEEVGEIWCGGGDVVVIVRVMVSICLYWWWRYRVAGDIDGEHVGVMVLAVVVMVSICFYR